MKILLQNINIISPGSVHHLKVKDVLIEGETIKAVENAGSISVGDSKVVEGENLYVSSGWFDLHVNFGEPGLEIHEDIESGCNAAMQGGFTGVLVMPATQPPVSGRSPVEYILSRAKTYLVDVNVAGTVSEMHEGKNLSEMYDMFLAGARVFTDDKKAVQDPGLMTRALIYVQNFGGRVFSFAEDKQLAGKGVVNEGNHAVMLGLKGIPSIAEEVMVSRDILLAEYTNSSLHFSTLSTKEGVAHIRKAKAKGLKITADVAASHLMLDDSSLSTFETVYKLKPPLRTSSDREALIEGLTDGTIDCITSDHRPQSVESKSREFELAEYGASGLETAFAVARTATMMKLSLPELISKFTTHPRACAGLKTEVIEKNHRADLTIFDPDKRWTVSEKDILSKSRNNPFLKKEITGKAISVINKGQIKVLAE